MDAPVNPRPRRKASRDVRRRQLIQATMEAIAEKGMTGATTAEVTRRAGLSMGIVSLHFESKEGLLTETLR
ncbi:MAG: TetR family transcriptional regulator, partial [Pseudomonadota bacterium]